MIDPLYKIQVQCQVCDHHFETSRVRPSFRKGVSTDSDFCIHYKDPELNPDFYVVRVCPRCGYAFSENFSGQWTEAKKQEFHEKVTANWTSKDYGGRRSLEDAIETYKLALLSAQIKQESERVIAGLLHHLAWLYRYQQDDENERRFLRYALESYLKVYEFESDDINNARLMYLIGELYRRLQQYEEAVKWFSRVVNDQKIFDSAMIAKSREQWKLAREEMKRERAGNVREGNARDKNE